MYRRRRGERDVFFFFFIVRARISVSSSFHSVFVRFSRRVFHCFKHLVDFRFFKSSSVRIRFLAVIIYAMNSQIMCTIRPRLIKKYKFMTRRTHYFMLYYYVYSNSKCTVLIPIFIWQSNKIYKRRYFYMPSKR